MHSSLRSPRFWLCGPLGFLLAVLLMLGMALWVPGGAADINNIVLPLVFFPALWACVFFYAYLDRSLRRVATVFSVLGVAHVALISLQFLD